LIFSARICPTIVWWPWIIATEGQSDFGAEYVNCNIFREGCSAVELLDLLGIARTTAIDTFRGGSIAMVLAAQHADRLS